MFEELPLPAARDAHALSPWFDQLAQRLADAEQWHRLFDLRLLQKRHALGLPLSRRGSLDDLEEPQRTQLEQGYLDACREVGLLLLEAARYREAWMYLRPAGDKLRVREHLQRVAPEPPQLDELIEIALLEGVDPERGFAWLLTKQGTCNAITTLDSLQSQLAPDELRSCASVLVRHIYRELRGNLRGHLHRLRGVAPTDLSVRELVDRYPELLANGNYHLDASHLASGVRYARLLTAPELVTRAWEMAEYGSRLPQELQYPGEPPFEENFPAHARFFAALAGHDVEAAVEYFHRRAADCDAAQVGSAPLEVLVVLLCRLQRPAEALDACARLLPADRELSPLAPTLLELAQQSGAWEQYAELCRTRNDVVSYAAGQLAAQRPRGA